MEPAAAASSLGLGGLQTCSWSGSGGLTASDVICFHLHIGSGQLRSVLQPMGSCVVTTLLQPSRCALLLRATGGSCRLATACGEGVLVPSVRWVAVSIGRADCSSAVGANLESASQLFFGVGKPQRPKLELHVFFSQDTQDSEVKRFCTKNILIILGFSSVMAVIALIAVGLTQNKPLPENVKYGIVLDAGSSHTNLYIYMWPAEKENDTGVVRQLEECKVKGPGISSYAQKTHEIDKYLAECMEMCSEAIPISKQPETPVYLGATAGMRLLRMESEQSAERVLAAVTDSLRKYSFDFQGAKIISGQDEGAYGWITINYLLGRFIQKHSWLNFISHDSRNQETYGALDLGGASTQITFVPVNDTIESPEDSLQFRLYGRDYTVYTHSFLCYGKDQALWQKLAKDIQVSGSRTLRDPCFHPGYEKTVNVSELYNTPCTKRFQKTLPFDEFQIQGTGDYEKCHKNILELFNKSYCPYSQCAFNGVFLPPLQGSFGAFSAFYFVMDFFKTTVKGNVSISSQKEMIEIIREFCSKPWEEVRASNPAVKEKYLSEYCFSGAYILALLLQGYNFTGDAWNQIQFMGKIQDSNAGWTLGYMLNLTNMIPAEQPLSPPLPYSTYVFLMVLFSLILVIVAITGLFICNKPSYFWKDMV